MFKKIVAAACLLGSVTGANALTLDCQNVANVPVAIAVSYLDYDGHSWMVEGWYTLNPGQRANIELDSSNDIFYIYGEFKGGAQVSGGNGALPLPVYYRTFKYVQGNNITNPDANVAFVRGVASNGNAQITFGPLQGQQ